MLARNKLPFGIALTIALLSLGAVSSFAGPLPHKKPVDRSYASSGYAAVSIPSGSRVIDTQCVAGADESIFVFVSATSGRRLLVKLNKRGRRANNFGKRGKATMLGGKPPSKIEIDANQRVLLYSGAATRTITRLTTRGRIDTSFGSNGRVALDQSMPKFAALANRTAMEFGILKPGTPTASTKIRMLDDHGKPDLGFNLGQPLMLNFELQDAAMLDDGRLLLNGHSSADGSPSDSKTRAVELRMLKADGTADTAWGTEGRLQPGAYPAVLRYPPASDPTPVMPTWAKIKALPSGASQVLVGVDGEGDGGGGGYSWSFRLTSSGAVDASYGIDGFADVGNLTSDGEGTYSADDFYAQMFADGGIGVISSGTIFGAAQNVSGKILSANGTDFAEDRPDNFYVKKFEARSLTYTNDARRLMVCGTSRGRVYVVALKVQHGS